MKKYMIPLLALTLIAGASNAQTTEKKPLKTSGAKTEMAKKTTEHKASVASVTPSAGNKSTAANTNKIIKRKHHKKAKTAKKTETK